MTTVLRILLAALLLTCLADMPYGYYQFVRFAGLVGFSVLAYDSFKAEQQQVANVYLCLALLFQPFVKVALGRSGWNVVDVVCAIFLLASTFIGRKTNPRVRDCSRNPASLVIRGVAAESASRGFWRGRSKSPALSSVSAHPPQT